MRNEFHQQANNLGDKRESEIELTADLMDCKMRFRSNSLLEENGADLGCVPIVYIETRNILDEMDYVAGHSVSSELKSMLLKKRNLNKEEVFYEQYHETEENLNTLDEIFHEVINEHLFSESGIMKYKEDSIDEAIRVKNIASA